MHKFCYQYDFQILINTPNENVTSQQWSTDRPCASVRSTAPLGSMNCTVSRPTRPASVGWDATQANTLAAFADVSSSERRDDIVPARDTNMRGGDTLYFTSGPYSVHTRTTMMTQLHQTFSANFVLTYFTQQQLDLPSVLWQCWLGVRKNIRPELSDEVLAWLSICSKVQMICMWSSWCHYHQSSFASLKSRLVWPFWCRLIQVVLENRLLNRSLSVATGQHLIQCIPLACSTTLSKVSIQRTSSKFSLSISQLLGYLWATGTLILSYLSKI